MRKRNSKIEIYNRKPLARSAEADRATAATDEVAEKCESHPLPHVAKASRPDEMAEIALVNPYFIMELSRTKPCDAAAQCQIAMSSLSNGFNRRKYELLGAAVGIAYNLQAVGGQWKAFCQEPFWVGFQRMPRDSGRSRNKALALVMRYVFSARSKNEINITNRYAKMLEKEYNGAVDPKDIADIIQSHGGIEKLRRLRVTERRSAKRKKIKAKMKSFKEQIDEEFGPPLNCDASDRSKTLKEEQYKKVRAALDVFYDSSKAYFERQAGKKA